MHGCRCLSQTTATDSSITTTFYVRYTSIMSCLCSGVKGFQRLSDDPMRLLQLKADVQFFTRSTADRCAVDIVDLACDLASLGYEIKVRYAEGGGANCFKNLCHEFILVKVLALELRVYALPDAAPVRADNACQKFGITSAVSMQATGDSKGCDVVVECGFHDHFRIPCATAAYSKLFNQLPAVYVGTTENMSPLVDVISREMARSFLEEGVTMPPWRGSKALMSKWIPQRAIDRLPGQASPRSRTVSVATSDIARSVRDQAARPAVSAVAEARVDTAGEPRTTGHSERGEGARTEIGALPRPIGCAERASSLRTPSTWHLRRSTACARGSPVLSVKLGFDYPGARPSMQ